jgi:hypothetical protein
MTADSLIDLIGRIHDEFDRRGWRDSGNTARDVAVALMAGLSPGNAAARVPNRFLLQNDITADSVEGMLQHVLDKTPLPIRIPRPSVVADAPASFVRAPRLPSSSGKSRESEQPRSTSVVPRKWPVVARVTVGAIIVIVSAIALILGPDAIHWTWLLGHPARLSLEWVAFFVAVSLAGAVVFWRREFLVVALVPGILALIMLLGH